MALVQASSSRTILSIDTSQPALGLALWQGDRLLASHVDHSGLPHSQQLFPLLRTVLHEHCLALAEIDVFGVNTGPGSFTGLRVGLAAVNGIAATLKKTVLGMNALDALACEAAVAGISDVVVILNASRNEVFWGRRRLMLDGTIGTIGRDRVLPFSQVVEVSNAEVGGAKTVYIGSGAEVLRTDLVGWGERSIVAAPESLAPAIAKWVNLQSEGAGTTSVRAYYIRPSDAEIKKQL